MTINRLAIFLIFTSTVCTGQIFPVTIDATRDYNFADQDSIVDHWGIHLPIGSNLSIVNWGEDYDIKFVDGMIHADTIEIHIHDTDEAFDYKYDLKIFKNRFSVNFWYQTTMDTAVRKIETMEGKLILKKKDFKKGAELHGYTEYKGKCVSYCDDENEVYIVRGTFKVRLK